MKLKPIAANMTELELNGNTILFSYKTPVACHIDAIGFFKTEKKWSVTTSKHIGKWLAGSNAELRPQSFFDAFTE